jgi:hypothetical protein
MTSALISRSRARHIRKFAIVSCPRIVLARNLACRKDRRAEPIFPAS